MKQRTPTRVDKQELTALFRKDPRAAIPAHLQGFHANIYNNAMAFADRAELRQTTVHFAGEFNVQPVGNL